MAKRLAACSSFLSAFLLLAAWPAAAAQVVVEPMRLPGAVMAAPMVGTRLGVSAAPSLRPSLTPSLQAPSFSPLVAPQVLAAPAVAVAPVGAAPVLAAPAVSAVETGRAVQEALSQSDAKVSEVLDSLYEGRLHAAPAVDLSATPAPVAGSLSQTPGIGGKVLLESLHEQTGRGYRSHEYKEASHYLFSTAYNIVRNGVHGVVDAYSGIFVPGSSANGGDYPEHGDQNHDGWVDREGMNVEHTWPQSFFDKALPMRSDLHHLLPTFQHPNSMRSNLPFGEVKGTPEYSNDAGAKLGGGVFEPPNAVKGTVARAVLYFFTRYYDRNITQGAYSHVFFADRIELFLRWNREHPPAPEEMQANEFIEKYQGNRNPFVDDPSLADRIGSEGFREMAGRPARRSGRGLSFTPQNEERRYEPQRKHGHHGRHGAPAQVGRLSPLDFALN
ncbi:MAG: endonuclease [Elusimicrobia bacterium]|nr:endonuclease [Elusimicrobiota bacterium]